MQPAAHAEGTHTSPVLGDGMFLGMVDFYLEDFEMHCYRKGNLGNPTLKQVPDPRRTTEEEEKGRSARAAGLGTAEPTRSPD